MSDVIARQIADHLYHERLSVTQDVNIGGNVAPRKAAQVAQKLQLSGSDLAGLLLRQNLWAPRGSNPQPTEFPQRDLTHRLVANPLVK